MFCLLKGRNGRNEWKKGDDFIRNFYTKRTKKKKKKKEERKKSIEKSIKKEKKMKFIYSSFF